MPDPLPPIGTRVRCKNGMVGVTEELLYPGCPLRVVFVRWPQGGGAWFTADEIEETDDE